MAQKFYKSKGKAAKWNMLDNIPLKRPGGLNLNSEFLDSLRVLECGSTGKASPCLPRPPAYSLFPLCFSSQAVSRMMGGSCTHIAPHSSPYMQLLHSIPQTSAPRPCLELRVVHAARGLLKMERLGGGGGHLSKEFGDPRKKFTCSPDRKVGALCGHILLASQTPHLIRGA